ncbi:MAG: hypothetical protein GY797_39175 [Deltaproteobacteria bacterium]|nr:hypothetical protein [Deltaproteobacteria bacterium]
MIPTEVIYLIPLSYGNLAAAKGVVLRHVVDHHRVGKKIERLKVRRSIEVLGGRMTPILLTRASTQPTCCRRGVGRKTEHLNSEPLHITTQDIFVGSHFPPCLLAGYSVWLPVIAPQTENLERIQIDLF